MAVVQYTAAVNQLRGKLNGSVFNKGKTSFTLQRKQMPPKGARGNQLKRRSSYSLVQRTWRDLTDAQRTAWQTCAQNNPSKNRFGEQVVLSGYNQFLKAGIVQVTTGGPIIKSPHTTPAAASAITSLAVINLTSFTNNAGDLIMSGNAAGTCAPVDVDNTFILDVSLPQSAGVTVYHRGFRYLGADFQTGTISIAFNTNLGNRYPSLSPNTQLFFRGRLFNRSTGAIVYTTQLRLILPESSKVASFQIAQEASPGQFTFTVVYNPVHTGVPDFHKIEFFQDALNSPPTDPSEITVPNHGADTLLLTGNTGVTGLFATSGQYVCARVVLSWAPTGEVLSDVMSYYQIP